MPAKKVPPLLPRQYFYIDRGIFARGTKKKNQPVYGCSFVLPAHVAQKYGVPRKRREIAGSKLTLARERLIQRKDQIRQKDFSFLQPPPQAIPTIGEFAARHLEQAKAVKKSWAFDRALLRPFCAQYGAVLIDSVTAVTIREYKAARARDLSKRTGRPLTARTINHELQVIHALFESAIAYGFVTRNPAGKDAVKRLRVPDKQVRVLSVDEEEKLMQAAPEHLRDLIALVLQTGLRKSEVLGLQGKHVDLPGRKLTIIGKGDKLRYIPLEETALSILRKRIRPGHLFTWNGKPILDVKVAWKQTVRRAGIPHITFHNLRDTYATRQVHLGTDLVTLQSLLGHEDVATTRKYAHPTPEANREAARRLERAFGSRTRRAHTEDSE
jgi:integrase